jgi:hypothetical protein
VTGPTALLLLSASIALVEPPSLAELLERAGEYVVDFEHDASGVVLEEAYRQSWHRPESMESRVLTSDFVLVSLPGEVGVFGFRDVFRVDGHAVRDRDARLERLFLEPSNQGLHQARAILDESARYNLGGTVRNFNLPTVALAFLRPAMQSRFAFRDKGRTSVAGRAARKVAYEETSRPTLIRDPSRDADALSRGTFVIDAETGAVLRTELVVDDEQVITKVVVEYQWVRALKLWLPSEMLESYDSRGGGFLPGPSLRTGGSEGIITTVARYSKPRRFQVTTEEQITPPR